MSAPSSSLGSCAVISAEPGRGQRIFVSARRLRAGAEAQGGRKGNFIHRLGIDLVRQRLKAEGYAADVEKAFKTVKSISSNLRSRYRLLNGI